MEYLIIIVVQTNPDGMVPGRVVLRRRFVGARQRRRCSTWRVAAWLRPGGGRDQPPALGCWFGLAARRAREEAEMLKCLNALTLATHDMARAVAFYGALGFELKYGGPQASFTSFHAGSGYLNLTAAPTEQVWCRWGRVIFYVDDVDAQHARAVAAGLSPASGPHDAPWGERFFHIVDPDAHELSFARPL
jgi:catechol 2,3-dioxygenase-like lactoylglutathione lyase family enzyme